VAPRGALDRARGELRPRTTPWRPSEGRQAVTSARCGQFDTDLFEGGLLIGEATVIAKIGDGDNGEDDNDDDDDNDHDDDWND
jgi:hypothetical protein